MVKFKNKMGKILALALIAAVCSGASMPSVYASGPSGPASDLSILIGGGEKATGPGAQMDGEQEKSPEQPQQPGENQPEPEQLQQPEENQPEPEQPQQPDENQPAPEQPEVEETASGKIKSGGRWIDPSKPMIALTFDDGPYAPVGNRIMDSLEQYKGRATFFVVGNRVASYKSEIKRMHDNGHEVANHTYEHAYLTKLNAAEIRSQIERCNSAVAAVTGEAPKLVRLPGGLKNNTVLANINYPIIMWSVDTRDWKTRNAQKTIEAVIGTVKDGDIVLLHELYQTSGDAAVSLIKILSEQGYQLVTVSELAKFRGGVQSGKIYSSFRP